MRLSRAVFATAIVIYFSAAADSGLSFSKNEGILRVTRAGQELLACQFQPLESPTGGPAFAGSDFIHPLKTPSGFCVTDLQPADHRIILAFGGRGR
jgi:hypothetical protein